MTHAGFTVPSGSPDALTAAHAPDHDEQSTYRHAWAMIAHLPEHERKAAWPVAHEYAEERMLDQRHDEWLRRRRYERAGCA